MELYKYVNNLSQVQFWGYMKGRFESLDFSKTLYFI
jgi:hypothetical protein